MGANPPQGSGGGGGGTDDQTLAEVLIEGATTSGTDITLSAADGIEGAADSFYGVSDVYLRRAGSTLAAFYAAATGDTLGAALAFRNINSPGALSNHVKIYSKDVGGKSELWCVNENGEYYVLTGNTRFDNVLVYREEQTSGDSWGNFYSWSTKDTYSQYRSD